MTAAIVSSYHGKKRKSHSISILLFLFVRLNNFFAGSSALRIAGKVSQEELASWERLGEGGFSSVYKAKLKGNDVAVKVLKNLKETKPLLTEGNLLRYVLFSLN